jgi:uncharacterized protein YqeY
MSLEQQINDGIKIAMKAKNEPELRSFRAIKAAILLAKTSEDYKGDLTEADEIKLLQKLAKQRKDSLEIFRQQHRDDLARKEEEELAVIERFLPKQMNENELRDALKKIIEETGASSPADMGKVMSAATKQLAGKADGKVISGVVKELLSKQ